ncbi:UDP-N-acetylmuramate--L-alanine ligase [Candidatus Nomurabacteria bacterium]|nr:UDP-N-acetylmuramate--L-alanine ligase [Candidatus Nomurabacteria bacterium]
MNLDLSKIKKIFFIGIGGIGISALAKMALSRGIEVLGINDEESGKTLDPLRDAGAIIYYQNEFKELPDADMYVFSDAWIYRGPELILEARKRDKPTMSYFEALGEFAKGYKVIAIAGTHGKTTTTAMVAEILVDAGLDPTVVVGSFVEKFGSNFRKGKSEYLVVEADEYNRHFLNFNPFIAVVTNVEADHLDCYKDLVDIQDAFNKFISQSEKKVLDYSKYIDKVPKLSVPGLHNRMNAAAAFAVADVLNIDEKITQKSLAEFSGTWRRLEKRGATAGGTIVYDDYAHHPTEIKASLQALRELYPVGDKKIMIVFQPHLYSRTKALFNDFAKSFKGADKILLLPIFFARETKDDSISSEKLAEAIVKEGDNAQAFSDFKTAETFIETLNFGPNDVFVTMGAGEAYKVTNQVFKIS